MELQIVNPDPRYAPAALLEPATSGYIHIGAEVRPPPRPGPLLFRGRAKRHLLATLDELARRLERERAVEKVTVYEAVAIPTVHASRTASSAGPSSPVRPVESAM